MAKKKRTKVNTKRTIITLVAVYVVCHLVYGACSIVDLKLQQRQLAQDLDAAYVTQSELQADLEYMSSEDAIEEYKKTLKYFLDLNCLTEHINDEVHVRYDLNAFRSSLVRL